MPKVNRSLQNYWILVSAHRRGKEKALRTIELLATEQSMSGALCRQYLHTTEAQSNVAG